MKKPLSRKSDWPERLSEYVELRRKSGCAWGEHDCVLGALGAVKSTTGVDLAEKFRGTYSSILGAAKAMKRWFNASSLSEAADVVAQSVGAEEIPVLLAQRGDVLECEVVTDTGEASIALGFVGPNGKLGLFVGPDGWTEIPVKRCRRAWRVG